MDNNPNQDAVAPPEAVQTPKISQTPEIPISSQPTGSDTSNTPPTAPESPTNASTITLTEDQNGGVNQPESEVPESTIELDTSQSEQTQAQPVSEPVQSVPVQSAPTAPAPLAPPTPQTQSSAQQEQTGFIRALLAKAQAKIQSNKQKKLDKIIQFAQKKQVIANEDVQKLLRISSATATRYLVKLVQQGRLARVGNPRDAKYQFLR